MAGEGVEQIVFANEVSADHVEPSQPAGDTLGLIPAGAEIREHNLLLRFAPMVGAGCVFFFACAVIAYVVKTMHHFYDPCDQPLNWYLVIMANQPAICNLLLRMTKIFEDVGWIRRSRFGREELQKLLCAVLILWGGCMIHNCKTCQATNPWLFNAAALWIGLAGSLHILHFMLFVFWRARVEHGVAGQALESAGCSLAMQKLPCVLASSPELTDPEDGLPMTCVICTECLGGAEVVVKTCCSHLFHKQCLAKWCENHTDCPVCRRCIG